MVAVAIALLDLSDAVADLSRFPDHKTVGVMLRSIARQQDDLAAWYALNQHREADYTARRDWLRRCYRCWDKLDDAHIAASMRDTAHVGKQMLCLERLLGSAVYWRGLMPVEGGAYARVTLR